jgi:cellulose synthase/poly-beta-1,6-N-acetylglucosamine synthase-like glycosyltransferase
LIPLLVTSLYGAAAMLGAAFALVELRTLARFLKNRRAILASSSTASLRGAPLPDTAAPTVTVQIPLYNERTLVDQILSAAAAQDYPRDRFDIQVLDDSTDETSTIVARAVERHRAEGVRIQHLRRTHRKGYKAGALAEGLERSTSEFVAVFDADFVPEPSFLRRVLLESSAFDDPKVAFVQGRWAWGAGTEGWLPSALALLLDRHFRVQKPTRAYSGNVTIFNGSGGVLRRRAIDEAGGWTSDTLTEDLDLSYRCHLAGWHGRYLRDVKVLNELPAHIRAFKLQQQRWARGNAQCFRKLSYRVMSSGEVVRDRWDEAFTLAGYAIHPLLLACLFLWPLAVVYVDRTLFWVLQGFMSLGMVAAFLSFLITMRERDARLTLTSVLQVAVGLAVGMGLMVNNTVGQVQGFLAAGGEFVRTPKGEAHFAASVAPGGTASPSAYQTPLHWTFFAEILVIGYCFAGTAWLIQHGQGLWSLALIFWGACLGLMVQQQLAYRPT